MPGTRHERSAGDGTAPLREDVRVDAPGVGTCPTCALALPKRAIRCPRCNTLVLTGCSGSCSSCGSRGCPAAPRS